MRRLLLPALALVATALPIATASRHPRRHERRGSTASSAGSSPTPSAAARRASGRCSPNAQGNVPAAQFIGVDEFVDAIQFMNSKPEWQRYLEVLPLDGRMGENDGDARARGDARPTRSPATTCPSSSSPRARSTSRSACRRRPRDRQKSDIYVAARHRRDRAGRPEAEVRHARSRSTASSAPASRAARARPRTSSPRSRTARQLKRRRSSPRARSRTPRRSRDVLKKMVIYFAYPNPDGWRRGSVSSAASSSSATTATASTSTATGPTSASASARTPRLGARGARARQRAPGDRPQAEGRRGRRPARHAHRGRALVHAHRPRPARLGEGHAHPRRRAQHPRRLGEGAGVVAPDRPERHAAEQMGCVDAAGAADGVRADLRPDVGHGLRHDQLHRDRLAGRLDGLPVRPRRGRPRQRDGVLAPRPQHRLRPAGRAAARRRQQGADLRPDRLDAQPAGPAIRRAGPEGLRRRTRARPGPGSSSSRSRRRARSRRRGSRARTARRPPTASSSRSRSSRARSRPTARPTRQEHLQRRPARRHHEAQRAGRQRRQRRLDPARSSAGSATTTRASRPRRVGHGRRGLQPVARATRRRASPSPSTGRRSRRKDGKKVEWRAVLESTPPNLIDAGAGDERRVLPGTGDAEPRHAQASTRRRSPATTSRTPTSSRTSTRTSPTRTSGSGGSIRRRSPRGARTSTATRRSCWPTSCRRATRSSTSSRAGCATAATSCSPTARRGCCRSTSTSRRRRSRSARCTWGSSRSRRPTAPTPPPTSSIRWRRRRTPSPSSAHGSTAACAGRCTSRCRSGFAIEHPEDTEDNSVGDNYAAPPRGTSSARRTSRTPAPKTAATAVEEGPNGSSRRARPHERGRGRRRQGPRALHRRARAAALAGVRPRLRHRALLADLHRATCSCATRSSGRRGRSCPTAGQGPGGGGAAGGGGPVACTASLRGFRRVDVRGAGRRKLRARLRAPACAQPITIDVFQTSAAAARLPGAARRALPRPVPARGRGTNGGRARAARSPTASTSSGCG